MSYVFPAIRGKMGSTEYFQANAPARSLVAVAKTASEIPDWQNWSLFERIQREVTTSRVRKEIVPYLTQSKDRFFGSLIVVAYEPDIFQFEPIGEDSQRREVAYKQAAQRMGYLTVDGGSLVALDGQHRLVALREVITGASGGSDSRTPPVADDELCVVFVRFESFEKTRRIFNKVNRNARPTSPTDNIITSEDDGYAIVTRWLVEPEPPLGLTAPAPPLSQTDSNGESLIEWRMTTISQTSHCFTTLSALYQTVKIILSTHGIEDFDEKSRVNRPSDSELREAYTAAATWWNEVVRGIANFDIALQVPEGRMRSFRSFKHGENSLLFRPIGQIALFKGLEEAVKLGLTIEEAVGRANQVRWRASHRQWRDLIIRSNGRLIATEAAWKLTGRYIAYQIASGEMGEASIDRLTRDVAEAKGLWTPESPRNPPGLPTPIF